MPKPTDYDRTHRRNMAAIGTRIDRIFKKATEEAAKIGVSIKTELPDDRIFSFADFPETQKQIERLLAALKESMETAIVNGVRSSWTLSNNKNNALVSRIFGDRVGSLSKEQYRRYFSTNADALEAFLQRRERGLNLSERVWRYTNEFKREIELGLDLGIRTGESAASMTRSLRQYLQHPDKLFRRVRDKHGNLRLSKAAAAFHPGRGVYRSSYKNARRLAATETNIAYRTSDYLRWQQLEFVVGIEIKLSNNHTLNGVPLTDICDTLAGRYPKDFKFTGWHPNCRCHVVTVLKTDDEMAADTQRILAGEQPQRGSVNAVTDVPDAFKGWVEEHANRIEMGRNLPYFVKDNQKRVNKILGIAASPQKTPLEIAKERHDSRTPAQAAAIQQKWNEARIFGIESYIQQGYLPKEVAENLQELAAKDLDAFNDRIKFLQRRAALHADRTPADRAAIQQRWDEKLKRDAKTRRDADRVLALSKTWSEVDYSVLEDIIAKNNLTAMPEETRKLMDALKAMRAQEKALEDIIPNAHQWHKTFTLAELKNTRASIIGKLSKWESQGMSLATNSDLEQLKKKLEFEMDYVENPGKYKSGAKPHAAWAVAKDAYGKQLQLVETRIQIIKLNTEYSDLLTFSTTSKDFKEYMSKAKAALDAEEPKTAQFFLNAAKSKKKTLENSRKGRAATNVGASQITQIKDSLFNGGCPYSAAELKKLKEYEDNIIDYLTNGGTSSAFSDLDDYVEKYRRYTLQLSEKYYTRQASLYSDAENAKLKAMAKKYTSRQKINPNYVWGTDVGGIYDGSPRKIANYLPSLTGLTEEELSIVQRFTNGSTFSNAYNLRGSSAYWAKTWKSKMATLTTTQAKEMEAIIEEWSQGANYVLDKMVRYNGITFRGLNGGGGGELRSQLTAAFSSGRAWVNEASCSTSMKHSVAESFDGDVILIIHNKTGAYIHPISDYSREYEIMTLRGTKYRIIKPPTYVSKLGRYYAELEEI